MAASPAPIPSTPRVLDARKLVRLVPRPQVLRANVRFHTLLALAAVVVPTQSGGQTPLEVLAITTATDFSRSWPEPGGLGVVFCRGLTGINGIVQAPGFPLSDSLGGVQVNLTDVANAPILAVADFGSYQQVNFQAPWTTSAPVTSVSVSQEGTRSAKVDVPTAGWSPFFADSSGLAVAQHAEDYRRVTREDPAHPGEWIIAYGSSIGAVRNPPPSGMPAPLDALSPVIDSLIVPAFIPQGGSGALQYNYIGLTPGAVGVWQVNLRVPDVQPDGDLRLVMLRTKFCGFFFVIGCGRGFVTEQSVSVVLPIRSR